LLPVHGGWRRGNGAAARPDTELSYVKLGTGKWVAWARV
jgi:hypothetical protein